MNWREGQPDNPTFLLGYPTWQKWIESAAYVPRKEEDPKLEEIIDTSVVDLIEKNRAKDGYYKSIN